MSLFQCALFAIILIFSGILFFSTILIDPAITYILLIVLMSLGVWICRGTYTNLGDQKLRILITFWLLKIVATLLLLYLGWMPQLDPTSENWGYDPQRYYYDAWALVKSEWNPEVGSNYQGILFYYGALFYIFDHNPIIPALVNSFVTLLGIIFLIRSSYMLIDIKSPKRWTIAYLLLIPEMLWYDVMTTRETLMAILIILASLSYGRYIVGDRTIGMTKVILLSGLSIFGILLVRTSMAISVLASMTLITFSLGSRKRRGFLMKTLLLTVPIGMVLLGPAIQIFTGGIEIDYLSLLANIQSYSANVASVMEWSHNSIGQLIAPNNFIEFVIFLPLRMILYLVAPLPNIEFSLPQLFSGSWFAWQNLMASLTSILMILGFPYLLSGTLQAWSRRVQYPGPMLLQITFWVTFISVAGGNIIIHERYRIMFTLLFFSCVWIGYISASKKSLMKCMIFWYGLLSAGAIFYISYKSLA